MSILKNLTSRTGFLILGFLFALGISVTYAAWAPSPKNPLDPLYSSDWNTVAHNASSWERTGDINLQGNDIFSNTLGGVGIGNTSLSADLKVDVEGKVGATHFCDNEGLNCLTTEDVISGELAGIRGLILDGGLQMVGSNIGIITAGCGDGQILKYIGGAWQCADDGGSGTGTTDISGVVCTDNEILKYIGGVWQCATDLTGGTAGADTDWEILGNDMYSTVTGNIGIGTTTPNTKLEVQGGSIKATDGLIIEVRTDNPTGADLVDGRIWLRSDL